MTRWQLTAPACALAAMLAIGACGRDDDANGNHWAGKPDTSESTANGEGNATETAGNADAQGEQPVNDASGMAISLVGCVRRAAPGSGRYLLSDVQTAGMGDTPAVGTSGRVGEGQSAAGDRYELVARTGQDLGEHVGRRVKITGRLATPTTYDSGASRPDATAGTSGTSSSLDSFSRTMYVSSVQRFGDGECFSGSSGR